SSTPHHRFSVHGSQGPLTLALEASLSAPWTILFGPSGSGKSTLLRALAGLTPSLATTFDRHDPATSTWGPLQYTATQHRALAYDPQQALLLPNLTVAENIRFPETLRDTPTANSLVPELTELLQLNPLLPKRPQQLSGGERQRVSLARALAVPGAKLLLLDEPFAGLDRALRDELLPHLQAHLTTRSLPVLSVTHDPDEALLLGAEVLRLNDGHLTAQGPAHQVLADEITRLQRLLSANS
ncbi:MAG TPA: ATP-binding cassette domain-containing protein, partial [Acidobacteriaceae bacterium]|nr:ATP-binding cassette domain-containing protein [Acidobacteriaceae bacterium]